MVGFKVITPALKTQLHTHLDLFDAILDPLDWVPIDVVAGVNLLLADQPRPDHWKDTATTTTPNTFILASCKHNKGLRQMLLKHCCFCLQQSGGFGRPGRGTLLWLGSEGRERTRCWEDGGNMSVSSAAIRGRNVLGLLHRLTQEEASQQKL